jgi:hypothetical protein
MIEKHVYHNGYDWIIATSAKEALEIHIDYTEYNDQDENEWKQVPDDEFITVRYGEEAEVPKKRPEGAELVRWDEYDTFFPYGLKATAKAWSDFADDPFLCTTEW